MIPKCTHFGDNYNFIYKNIDKKGIWVGSSSFAGFNGGCGILNQGGIASYQMVHKHGSVPDEVRISWTRLSDDKKFEKTMRLRDHIPSGPFRGDIIFVFNGTDVSVEWTTR